MSIDVAFLTALSGFVIAVLGIIVSLVTQRNSASKIQMEATQVELNSLRSTIETLGKENERLRKRLDDLEYENGALKDWAEALVCQVRGAGLVPVRFEEKTRPRGLG